MWLQPLLLSLACQVPFTEDLVAGTRHLSVTTTTGVAGAAVLRVPVEPGEVALLATAQVDAPLQAHFRSLVDPNGQEVFGAFEWNDSPYSKTNAGFISRAATLNWPIQDGDPELIAGKWELAVGVVDVTTTYVPGAPFTLDLYLKQDDPAFTEGDLVVSVVYAGPVADNLAARAAVEEARDLWVDLYAKLGIAVVFDTYTYSDGDLGAPAFAEEAAYTDIAAQTAPRSVNLVLTEEIDEIGGIFGIAGDIPGPLVPSPRSAVQISMLLAAGPDGDFSSEDVRLLAETMAHEVGHYLGLFHPVEATWEAWDVLDDTEDCDSEFTCTSVLGDNLMFPYPVCGVVTCTPQDQLTAEQAGVVNRYVGVD